MLKFILLTAVLYCFSVPVFAAQNTGPFKSNVAYNIYFEHGESNYAVLDNVEIVRFEEIAGKVFVVVHSSGFKLKEEEGFILFDSIAAILPDRNFRVKELPAHAGTYIKYEK